MAFGSDEQRKAVMAKLRGALGSKPVVVSTEMKPEEQAARDIKYISDTDIVMGPEEVPHLFEDRHHIENLEIDAALRGTGGVIDRHRTDLPVATKSYYEKFPYIHPMEKDPKARAKFSEIVKEGGVIKKVGNTFVELRPTEVGTIVEAANDENIPKNSVIDILRNAIELPDEIHEIGGDASVGIAPTDVVFHDGVYYSNLRALPVKKSKVIQWRDDDEKSEDYVSKGDWDHSKYAKRPQALGSKWEGEKYVHGPRIRQPKDFIFMKTVEPEEKYRHIEGGDKIPVNLADGSKLVIGKLREGDWAVQSILTPR